MQGGIVLNLLIVGHSHVRAILEAYEARPPDDRGNLTAWFVPLRDARFTPTFETKSDRWGRPEKTLNPALEQEITKRAPTADFIVSCIGGSEHNIFGLVNHPQPFDFVLDEAPDLELRTDCAVLPEAYVRAMLEPQVRGRLSLLKAIQALTGTKIAQIEPPPVVPSNDYVRRYPGTFRQKVSELGVSPPSFRWKVWRLCGFIVRDFCTANSIHYVESPPQTRDEQGYLVERAWGNGPTHGNTWYGEQVLSELRRRLPALHDKSDEAA